MSNVLYDAPGPRTRRMTVILSLVTALAIAYAAYRWLYLPLKADGQFTAQEWGPLLDPDYEVQGQKAFPLVWQRIGEGWLATAKAAGLAIVTSLAFGTLLAIVREQLAAMRRRRFPDRPPVTRGFLSALILSSRGSTKTGVEYFRGLPVVITIFFTWVVLRSNGVQFDDALWYLVIGLTLYNGVVIGEILRSGMAGLPRGQREAAASIGLGATQTTWLILLPQTFRVMLPALISQLVVIVKDTSLGFIISYEETLAVGKQLVLVLHNPIPMFFVIGVTYILVNYTLSALARSTERRLAGRQRRTAARAGLTG